MTEENRQILERQHDRHEGMIRATFGLAFTAALVAILALWRTI
jgi:hypothetical protein